jgi:hypothetical protein
MKIFLDPFGWFSPDLSKLPGGGTFHDLVNGIGGFVLVAALLGLVLSAGAWAIGVGSGNIGLAERGKQGAIVAGIATLLVGAAAKLLDFWFAAGQGLH